MNQTISYYSIDNHYIIISPVKDEEKYIETTIKSIVSQTIKPSLWIIVDDCSRDRTVSIIEQYCHQHPWIKLIRTDKEQARQPGTPVINAFKRGYHLVQNEPHDFIVKLDCDLRLNPDYFERLIAEFANDKKLGIASGIYLEETPQGWVPITMPPYHAAGASKMVRNECFRQIGGFIPAKGWDTIDEIKAQCQGWETKHFADNQFYHLRIEGSGIGIIKTSMMHGEIYYATGGGFVFLVFKVIHRMIYGKPFFISGALMLFGFLKSFVLRKKRLVSEQEANHYKRLLNQRVTSGIKNLFGMSK